MSILIYLNEKIELGKSQSIGRKNFYEKIMKKYYAKILCKNICGKDYEKKNEKKQVQLVPLHCIH